MKMKICKPLAAENFKHPTMIKKINQAMLEALKDSKELAVGNSEVMTNNGKIALYVVYTKMYGFTFFRAKVIKNSLMHENFTKQIRKVLEGYKEEVQTKLIEEVV